LGICLDVHSIVYPPAYPPIAPHTLGEARWYAERWHLVVLIAERFGWHKLPWDEPSPYHSADSYCCNKSKYDLLRAVACAVAAEVPFTTPETAWALHAAENAPSRFQHLIMRNDSGYVAIYLPTEIAMPVVIPSTSDWESFTVGSAIHLKNDADELAVAIRSYGCERGTETVVEPRDYPGKASHIWSALEELCQILSQYAQESIEQKVPMFISW
jgi:hypothetical protein